MLNMEDGIPSYSPLMGKAIQFDEEALLAPEEDDLVSPVEHWVLQ